MEAICTSLSILIPPGDKTLYVSRYAKLLQRYNLIKKQVMGCPIILERTGLSLYPLNEKRLSKW